MYGNSFCIKDPFQPVFVQKKGINIHKLSPLCIVNASKNRVTHYNYGKYSMLNSLCQPILSLIPADIRKEIALLFTPFSATRFAGYYQ